MSADDKYTKILKSKRNIGSLPDMNLKNKIRPCDLNSMHESKNTQLYLYVHK